MSELKVFMKVPVPTLNFANPIQFGRENAVETSTDFGKLEVWIDEACCQQPLVGSLEDYSNLYVEKMHILAFVSDISPNLVRHIQSENAPSDSSLTEEYSALGTKLFAAAIERVNGLLAFARCAKGQYWARGLESQITDGGIVFEAEARIDDGQPFWFCPFRTIRGSLPMASSREMIGDAEWRQSVTGNSKFPLSRELLAYAKQLRDAGYRRSSLMEAYSALEVSIYDFCRSAPESMSAQYCERMGLASLKNQVDRLGVSGTIRYLLPVLIGEDQLSTETLKACRLAVEQRQNVVHNGQRDVQPVVLSKSLAAISQICNVLSAPTG